MTDDLDLRAIHQSHEPDPLFRAALQTRIDQVLAGVEPAPAQHRSFTDGEVINMVDLEPSTEPSPGSPSTEARRRSRRWLVAASILTAAAATAAAIAVVISRDHRSEPAAPTVIPLTPESVAGIWVSDNHLQRIGADGSFAFFDSGNPARPDVVGTYEIDGATMTFTFGPESWACVPGESVRERVVQPEEGRLHRVILRTSPSPNCDLPVGLERDFIRLSPASPAAVDLVASTDPQRDLALTNATLKGIWMTEGGGTLLQFGARFLGDPNSHYAIDDGGMLGAADDDAGTYHIDGATLTFTSDGSGRCPAGVAQVWEQVQLRLDTLRATVSDDHCGNVAAGAHTWIRVFPRTWMLGRG
jgi:hypothetical protein